MRSSLLRLASSVALSLSVALAPVAWRADVSGLSVPYAEAAKPKAKLSPAQMMTRMEQALVLISTRLAARPAAERKRAAPLVKALVDANKALKAVKSATNKKKKKALAAALPKASAALARVDKAFRLSGIKAKSVSVPVASLKGLWRDYLARTGAAAGKGNKERAVANARRINGMKKQLRTLGDGRASDRRLRAQLAEIERRLDQAEAANRSLQNQWLATLLIAEALGLYSGYYDYVVVYYPSDVRYYDDSYAYFSAEYRYSYREYGYYYEEYSWSYYNEPVYVSTVYDYDFGMSERDYRRFETTYVSTYERYEYVTETTIVNQQQITIINNQTDTITNRAATMQTVASVPDPQVDTVEVVAETPVDAQTFMMQSVAEDQQLAAQADQMVLAEEPPVAASEPEPPPPVVVDENAVDAADVAPDARTLSLDEMPAAPETPDAPADEPQADEAAPPEQLPADAPADPPQDEQPQDEQAPAEEAPVEEPQAEEAPVEEPQAEEAPVEEPQAEEAPVEEPQVEEAPVEEPQVEEAPVEEPQAEEAPVEEPQVEEAPVEEPQAEEAPIEEPQYEEPAPEPEP